MNIHGSQATKCLGDGIRYKSCAGDEALCIHNQTHNRIYVSTTDAANREDDESKSSAYPERVSICEKDGK